MVWVVVLGAVVVVAMYAATRSGRVQLRTCCPADPRLDLRMRAAFDEETPSAGGGPPAA